MKKDFLSITDLNNEELWKVLLLSKKLKNGKSKTKPLDNKSGVLIFEKPSLRTKLSFDLAIKQLGGHAVYFGDKEVGLGQREKISDVAGVVASMADLIVARVNDHASLKELSDYSRIPVINALSDLEHPCQALADLLTIMEIKGKTKGLKVAFIGDGENNVTHSLLLGCVMLGIDFACASPSGYNINKEILKKAKEIAQSTGSQVLITEHPEHAVKSADVVYTDTWVSMGDEAEAEKRKEVFSNYQVSQNLMSLAKKDAIFMHDMPAYRGSEVATEVIDGKQSVVFQQAQNRLFAQKGLLAFLLK
jgi:ornithine carbamoyltransferase